MASFTQLLKDNVDLAFNLIGDLAEDVTLKTTASVDYDFSTSTTNTTADTQKVIKGVISKIYSPEEDNSILLADIIVKSTDISVDEIDNYDVVNFRNKDWNMRVAKDNSYIITITVQQGE